MKTESLPVSWIFFLIVLFTTSWLWAGEAPLGDTERKSELDQIVVSASRTEQRIRDAASPVYVIGADDIRGRQASNVQGLLREIPGVRIEEKTGSWGKGGNVSLMGMDPDKTLILLDGQRFTGGRGSVDISSIPVENIERIEVVKGPGSALYGADAMAGVINIITRKAEKGTWYRVGLRGGSRDRLQAATGVNAGTDRIGALLAYTGKYTTGVDRREDTTHNHALSGSIHYEPVRSATLRIQPFYSRQKNEVEGEPDRIQKRIGLNADAAISPGELSRIEVRGSYFSHDHFKKNNSFDALATTCELETGYSRFIGGHHIRVGYSYFREDLDDRHKDFIKDNQYTHGFYLHNELFMGIAVLTLGGRVDRHDDWGTEINPRGGIVLNATRNLRFRGSVGTAFAAPTLIRLYADGWKMGAWTMLANPDLKPEKSFSYLLGMDFESWRPFLIRTTLFRNEIEDLIETVREGRTMTYRNVNEAVTQGVETSITWRPSYSFAATMGYTYTDTENKQTGRSLADRPEHHASLDLDYYLPRPDVRFRLIGNWTGKRKYGENEAHRTCSAYTTMDLVMTHYLTDRLEVFCRLENLTNEKAIGDESDLDGTEWLLGMNYIF